MIFDLKKLLFFSVICCLFSCDSPREYEVAVIGGGLMGSSTAYYLAKNGKKVVLLEQQDSIYSFGSSFGEARIARSLGSKGDIFSYLHNTTVEEVRQLVNFLNANGDEVVSMQSIYVTSPVTYVRHRRQADRIEAILEGQEDRYEYSDNPADAVEKFHINLPDSTLFLREYKEHSGTINPQQLIHHLHEGSRLAGGQVRYQTRVDLLSKEKDGTYRLSLSKSKTGKKEKIHAGQVVSAAGPYTGEMLSGIQPFFNQLIDAQRVFLVFLKVEEEVWNDFDSHQRQRLTDGFPAINSSAGTRNGSFFTMIEKLDTDGIPIIKVGGHFQRSEVTDPDLTWSEEVTVEEIDWGRDNIHRYLRLLGLPIDPEELQFHSGYSCIYSLTQNEVPIVSPGINSDLTPDHSIVILGGMSGVGAKGAMKYGWLASRYLLGIPIENPMDKALETSMGFERLKKDVQELRGSK